MYLVGDLEVKFFGVLRISACFCWINFVILLLRVRFFVGDGELGAVFTLLSV